MHVFYGKMNRLNLYVLRQFVGPLFATFFVIIFVLLLQFVWMFIDDLVGKGLPTSIVLEFFYYAFLRLMLQALPLTILLSSIMVFGSLGESLELLSMKAAGISLMKIMRPMIILVSMLTVGAFFFADHVETEATKKLATLRYDIGRKNPEMNIKEKVFNYDLPGMSIKIDKKDKESGMLYGLMIYDHSHNDGNTSVTIADSGRIETASNTDDLRLVLFSGRSFSNLREKNKRYDKEKVPYRRDTFSMQVIRFGGEDEMKRSDASIYSRLWFTKRLPQLRESADSLQKEYDENLRRAQFSLKKNYYKLGVQLRKSEDFDEMSDSLEAIVYDSVFLKASLHDQLRTIDVATSFAKNVQKETQLRRKVQDNGMYTIKKHLAEMHKRFTVPLSCLIFFFIGAPFGAIIRKGGFGMPVIVSILLYILWYIINTFGTKMATEGISSVWFGMWLSTMILSVLGMFITYQAANDSVLMNPDNYILAIKKMFRKRKQKLKQGK